MQHLEGSGTPVLYLDARFLKVKFQAMEKVKKKEIGSVS